MSKFIRVSAIAWCRSAGTILPLVVAASAACALATPASAHGFGQRYDLPLPLSLYLLGAAAVVVFSFVIVGLFVRQATHAREYPRFNLLAHSAGRLIAHPGLVLVLKLVSLVLFVVTVTAGFLGDQNPYRNIAPTMVWIIVWVGLAYASAFVGDIWALINPWRTIFEGAESLYGRIAGGRDLSRRLHYPEALGVWLAVVLLLAFSWFELVYPTPAIPAQIACLAVGYSILTWTGMAVFGRETWLRHGEVFSVVFGTFARFAPTEARADLRRQELILRPFGAGLLDSRPASPSMAAFVLLLLSTVLYDGLLNTPEWSNLENVVGALLRDPGELGLIAIRSIGLVAFWLLFLGAYMAVSAIMSAAEAGRRSPLEIAQSFAFTLIPITIGYHLAHYLVFLLIQGQYIVPLISDPFGYGWNLFGTAGYRVDIAIVGARFAWYAAVTAIVVGHIAAVYLAHVKAMQVFESRQAALRSQVPLTALMVVYTFVSLSILAEPIVERRAPAQPTAIAAAEIAIPADAVLPEPGSGRLQPIGPGKLARVKLTYRVLGSAFHDGTRTNVADLLYAYMFAYRWGVRSEGSDAHYDPFIDSATATMRRQLAGLRAAGSDAVSKSFRIGDVNFLRELFTVEVYATVVPEDPERDAVVAPPWSTLPWHLIVLMEEAVDRGWVAFSKDEAARRGVEWLDLVRSERMNVRLASLIETFEREGYRPTALQSLVSAEEARKRWAALATFYKARGHFLVTNGPYRLKRWSKESVTLEAFRDLTYPLGVGSYDAYAIPRRAYVTKIEREKNRIRLFADIETIMKFQRSYRIDRGPMQSISRDILKRAAPECRYVVMDDEGRVVLAGTAPLADDLTFQADLNGKLAAGRYIMAALIAVNGNVMNADIHRIPLLISSNP
ncbi:MAG: hypothetical protein Q7S17_01175 [Xanthobacteraceae bacterium]|nr:hypothetical protein [Xanthobacteraceae bacterium]